MGKTIIKDINIINEGKITPSDILIVNDRIEKIASHVSSVGNATEIKGDGKYLMPGVIDDQVHFREPGLTHKANIFSESRAAIAGGTTTFMEMPNTVPNALTQELLADKYEIAMNSSLANYSFFMGTSNDNYEEVMKTDLSKICGLKIFMGSSTGNMLVDNENVLNRIFANFNGLIATHCEDEATVKANFEHYKSVYGNSTPPYDIHALIRNEEGCYKSSSFAVELAKRNKTRLHILHISSSQEILLFDNSIPLEQKHITSEVCVHHLWFDAEDYKRLGTKIKCNPAIKHGHRENLFQALLDDRFDIIATDHAPHLMSEKEGTYWEAHAGLPLVQHSLQAMLDFHHQGKISLERIVEKMSHAPAQCFKIEERGYIREGYKADLTMFDLNKPQLCTKDNLFAKCGWSPFEGHEFQSSVEKVWVNGHLSYNDGELAKESRAERLSFDRK
ncbi:dihydroorotase [Spirosomataceae bacterium TFI 002]|nr:dihydroorotase [Spirosomataceae bacterium TFI 002]